MSNPQKSIHRRIIPAARNTGRSFLIGSALLLALSSPAWGVQTHAGDEGLVSHQIGHILFALGMGYLLYRISRVHMDGRRWHEFKIFLWLLLAWNVLTFAGHWMDQFETGDKFVRTHASTVAFRIENLWDVFFYLTRLDHLLLVPACIFLLLALKKWKETTS